MPVWMHLPNHLLVLLLVLLAPAWIADRRCTNLASLVRLVYRQSGVLVVNLAPSLQTGPRIRLVRMAASRPYLPTPRQLSGMNLKVSSRVSATWN